MLSKKKPPGWEASVFVFAFIFTRRMASRSGEGKKESEEKQIKFHGNVRKESDLRVTVLLKSCQ